MVAGLQFCELFCFFFAVLFAFCRLFCTKSSFMSFFSLCFHQKGLSWALEVVFSNVTCQENFTSFLGGFSKFSNQQGKVDSCEFRYSYLQLRLCFFLSGIMQELWRYNWGGTCSGNSKQATFFAGTDFFFVFELTANAVFSWPGFICPRIRGKLLPCHENEIAELTTREQRHAIRTMCGSHVHKNIS